MATDGRKVFRWIVILIAINLERRNAETCSAGGRAKPSGQRARYEDA